MVVYVDVDDTIVRWCGPKCMPRTSVIDKLRERKAAGDRLFLWSRAGDGPAREVAEQLQIVDLFEAILPKPDHIVDDEPFAEWKHCTHEYPW